MESPIKVSDQAYMNITTPEFLCIVLGTTSILTQEHKTLPSMCTYVPQHASFVVVCMSTSVKVEWKISLICMLAGLIIYNDHCNVHIPSIRYKSVLGHRLV